MWDLNLFYLCPDNFCFDPHTQLETRKQKLDFIKKHSQGQTLICLRNIFLLPCPLHFRRLTRPQKKIPITSLEFLFAVRVALTWFTILTLGRWIRLQVKKHKKVEKLKPCEFTKWDTLYPTAFPPCKISFATLFSDEIIFVLTCRNFPEAPFHLQLVVHS